MPARIAAIITIAVLIAGCNSNEPKAAPAAPPPTPGSATHAPPPAAGNQARAATSKGTKPAAPHKLKDGLVVEDVVVGTGAQAHSGDSVTVQYTGTLKDGTKFDSSYDHGQPFNFVLGQHQVIKGWDEGVAGMKVGGTRKLVIPAALAYGDNGMPPLIPPKATLIFQVELVSIP